ncbi:unnamed protein product [Phytophthora fragariaefolia]|uniref:Unnamed protein product n=1 Tax=Phytophthora fragariaefolia TaxID=1490495 RepID=A0A9W7CR67_9STRA|nr:unnamed protein product [Phytophthora fragariaefolia]
MSTEAAAMALKSRAEVQLLSALNQKKARSAAFYLKEEQQKALAEDEEDPKTTQARNRIAFEALPACTEEARLVSEVRQLQDNFYVVGAEDNQSSHQPQEGPSQIELNDVRRRDRHMEAQMQYWEKVKAISEEVEVAIIRAADGVKEALAAIDSGIHATESELMSKELLLTSDNESILAMWTDLEAVCQRRTDEIALFAFQLEEIEQTRMHRVRAGLQHLTYTLMETAHALPPEVERIIEAEVYEVNTVVISNRRVYADLVARMGTANVEVFLSTRLAWEQGQLLWRHLRHDDAIARFAATLNSPLFTDPEERQHLLQQIRAFQENIHREHRLAALKKLNEAGATLSSEQAKHILQELSATQHFEEEKNQAFFAELRALHESKSDAAKALRESLRLELHGFGAMAKEGAIEEAKKTLVSLLSDDSMEDFFRAAGGLKTELDTLAKQLCIADLIYNANLEPVASSVGVLLSALPLESVLERQGKGAERKAVQATLEKIRKATKSEIMSLLPSLQTQISMLIYLDEMSDSFKAELGDIVAQLDTIIQESPSSPLKRTGSMSPVNSSASNEKVASRSPLLAVPVSTRKSSAMFSAASPSKSKTTDGLQSGGNAVDLQAIRKVQRRLGTLVYASELGVPWQKHLNFIADQLLLQSHANCIIDEVISRECGILIEKRQQESRLLMEEIGKRMEQQSSLLHDHVEKLTRFFLRVVLCVEESGDKVQYVNLSVMDLLDTLKENDDEALSDLETKFMQSCARLRHSPNDSVLRDEFQRSSDLLMHIEGEYRAYDKRVSLAADNNVVAIAKQRSIYLQRLCDFFGLKQLNQPESVSTFNLDYFLSAQHIEDMLNPGVQETWVDEASTAEAQIVSADSALNLSEDDIFRTELGFKLVVVLSLATLAQGILAQREDESGDQEAPEVGLTSVSCDEQESYEDEVNHQKDEDHACEAEADTTRLLQQAVLEKVQREFLVLSIPSDTVESMLATFRYSIISKYDSDAAAISTQTDNTRTERHASSSMLLEERLRVHWPRKGRLDVQFYQPRMGELLNHQQRQERHLRGLWAKVEEQQSLFAKRVEAALIHVEQARIAQVSFQAQLPLQLSLAALQGLEVKTKKHLGIFKTEANEIVANLRDITESDINNLLSSCQDYVRACSSQLFPDLTSCDVISGCDYHPDEITSTKDKLLTIEAQVRDRISEREKKIIEISNSKDLVLRMWQSFKTRYQLCVQGLAMKEGLGQKFGLPRRTAQERYRSEMTRCESRSASINALLASLQMVADEDKKANRSDSALDGQENTSILLGSLMQVRAKLYHRGMYFNFLRSPTQLELKPIAFNPLVDGGDQCVIRDHDVVDVDDQTIPTPFLEFADQVSIKCQEETRALYQLEGKIEELPLCGVPAALEEYLSNQLEKARLFVIQQEGSYREQVSIFGDLLMLVPRIVVMDFMKEAKQQMLRNISVMNSAFEAQFRSWTNLKNRHALELRPHLCSPNNVDLLQELEEREKARSASAQVALLNHRYQFIAGQIQLSMAFEARLVNLCHSLILLLDSSVLSLDDLKPFSGEELPKLKRKSLKRLRKMARVNESGDPREVKRTTAELQKLTQCGEAPRYPLRSWSAIPSFGLYSLWEEVKAEVLAKDAANESSVSSSIVKADSSIQNLACVPLASSDGACVALLTPAHRALIRARDGAYADYVRFCHEETRRFLDSVHERLGDEVKWTLSWQKAIENMK